MSAPSGRKDNGSYSEYYLELEDEYRETAPIMSGLFLCVRACSEIEQRNYFAQSCKGIETMARSFVEEDACRNQIAVIDIILSSVVFNNQSIDTAFAVAWFVGYVRCLMKKQLIAPKAAERVKVIGKIPGPRPGFVEWTMDTCCHTSCTRC